MSRPKGFTKTRKLRFADCDPAGIGFYPRLVEQVNNTVEDWFEDAIGLSFHEMHMKRDIGVPTRSLSVDFSTPAMLGELIDWNLNVIELRRSLIALQVHAHGPGGNRILSAKVNLVWCEFSGKTPKSQPIPEEIRNKMLPFISPVEKGIHAN
ncbi:MAG: thioesterase family protein [Paracoccaceae bacterium]